MASKLDPHAEQVRNLVSASASNKYIAQCFSVDEATVRRFKRANGLSNNVTGAASPDRLSHEADDQVNIPVIYRDYSHLDGMYVYPLGDVHKGAQGHQRTRWRQWVEYLTETPHTSMIGTGDFINAAILGSKSDVYDETMTVGDAKREIREELRPLAEQNRLDVLMPGNHEERVTRAIGDCPILDICESLDVNYAASAALLVYKVGDVEYEVYVRHGTGNGQAMSTLKKGAQVAQADVYVTGHTHQTQATADDLLVRVGDRLERRHRYYIAAGCFLGLESYAVKRGYPPSRIGAPRVWLDGTRHDVHASI
jgi:predicted phosphodiesterase